MLINSPGPETQIMINYADKRATALLYPISIDYCLYYIPHSIVGFSYPIGVSRQISRLFPGTVNASAIKSAF